MHMREETSMRINMVNELLLHNPTRWNKKVIELVFNLHEANIIQQILLAQGDIPDTMA